MSTELTFTSIETSEVVIAAVIIAASIAVITWLIFGVERLTTSKVEI